MAISTFTESWASSDQYVYCVLLGEWRPVCLLSPTNRVAIGMFTLCLPVVLYGCESWSLTLREEHGVQVFENSVLRRIFGAKKDDVTGEWRKAHNEELNDLYCSPNIVRAIKLRRTRWAGHVARMGARRGVYRVLVRKPEGKRKLGRPRRRWENNIKMDLQEIGCGGYGLDRAGSG